MNSQVGLSRVWVLTGPSGSGKTTLVKRLLAHVPNSRPMRRITTRTIRPSDVPGDYTSITMHEFERGKGAGVYAWTFKHNDYFHATPKEEVDLALTGTETVVTDLAIPATKTLFRYVRSNYLQRVVKRIKAVYLDLRDEEEARHRLTQRGETENLESMLLECRTWPGEARASGVPYHFVDASLPEDNVFEQALAHFTSP